MDQEIVKNYQMSLEKEHIFKPINFILPKMCFDESDKFFCFPSMCGIQMINMESKELVENVNHLGAHENGERILAIELYQGKSMKSDEAYGNIGMGGTSS